MRDCVDCCREVVAAAGREVVAAAGEVENYIVHDEVWAEAGMEACGGFLCVNCLEHRLGRGLTGADLPLDVPLNFPGVQRDTPRMRNLKSAAWGLL